ncbi:methyl-accepting chemotaxis protein [Lysinibacillus odysseyi]|uniref:Chemotaxis protein n=1 Tax=Lysinibacillus odysseyi 34hs-1 = NBRC 100172 TaxID=1220589 RepID=A0A0A3IGP4_9BACI|nr:methyl-accepting chemotaxis protein [Lysinibacillus odysseyi]KGR82655.1 hypothetical protein CD32_17495 [Lysinibacillus odysseyi 34hs-1 = NBRC 100172]
MFHFKSIRIKLTIWILLLAIVPLIAVTVSIQTINSLSLIDKEKAAIQEMVNGKSADITRWFEARTAEMEIAAESDIMKSLEPTRINPFLTTLNNRSEVFETMFVLNKDGMVIAHTKTDSIGSDYSDRTYYPTTLAGEASYSDVLISKATGNRIVVVTTPIKDTSGNVIGILAGSANFEELISTYLTFDDKKLQAEVTLVDGSGTIQLDNDSENIGKVIEESSLNTGMKKLLAASQTSAGIVEVEEQDQTQLLAYAPIDAVGYGLSIHTPKNIVIAETKKIQNIALGIIVLAACIIAAVSYLVIRHFVKPIITVTEGMDKVAEGNLTIEPLTVNSQDELGHLIENFNTMVHNTKNLVINIQHTADQVAASSEQLTEGTTDTVAAAEQISASVHTIATSAEQQASYTEDAKTVVTGISHGITLITDNIDETNTIAHHAVEVASAGTGVIQKTVTHMQRVEDTTDVATKTINHLGSKSSEIDKIIAVITSIADQTNLLALNAAIEAARAGEYGKGFAVVADEVRKLAEQSAQASGQIGQLIKEIQQEIHSSIDAMKEGTDAVKEGAVLVESAGAAFGDIVQVVNNVSEHMKQIHEESVRIQTSASRMVDDIENITEISISTSSSTQEIASASEEQNSSMEEMAQMANTLSAMAADLRQSTQLFQVK